LSQLNRLVEAESAFERAFSFNERLWEARLAQADVVRRQRRWQDAALLYDSVITGSAFGARAEPSLVQAAAVGRALCRAVAGDYSRALDAIASDIQGFPEDPVLAHIQARLWAAPPASVVSGTLEPNAEKALALIERLAAGGYNLELTETRAMALAASGQMDQAVILQEQVVAKARQAGRTSLLPLLERNLENYRGNRRCEQPWHPADPLLALPSYRR